MPNSGVQPKSNGKSLLHRGAKRKFITENNGEANALASPLFIFANRYRFNTLASTIHGPVVEWILRMPPEH